MNNASEDPYFVVLHETILETTSTGDIMRVSAITRFLHVRNFC